MWKFNLLFLAALLFCICSARNSFACQPLPDDAKTKRGWMTNEVVHEKPLRSVRGKVVDRNGDAVVGAYVEIFRIDNAETNQDDSAVSRKRVNGCETNENGKFNLPKLPPGKYDLIISANYFNTLVMKIEILSKGSSKKLEVIMEVSA